MRKREKKPPKPVRYKRLTWNDRLVIERLFNNGHSRHFIAKELSRSVSTISEEVRHGLYDHLDGGTWLTVRKYSAQIAQERADWQTTGKGVPIKLDKRHDYAVTVAERIKQGRSPDQITGRLRREGKWTVSTPTLYRYIDRGYIPGVTNKALREKPNRMRRYRHVKAKRPAKGRLQSVLVLTERLTRYEIILRVRSKEMAETVRALRSIISRYPKGTFKTLAVDNGSEFQDCNGMEQDRSGNKQIFPAAQGSTEKRKRVVWSYRSPALRMAEGKSGLLGESGKCWVSRQKPWREP